MKLEAIVVYTETTQPALQRTLDSVPEGIERRAWLVTAVNETVIRECVNRSSADWVMVLRTSMFLPPKDHVSYRVGPKLVPETLDALRVYSTASLAEILDQLPAEVDSLVQYAFCCSDRAGNVARGGALMSNLVRRTARFEVTPYGFKTATPAVLVAHPVLTQPVSAYVLENGDFEQAFRLSYEPADPIERQVFLKARTELETRRALACFDGLFTHMSLNEELWRLKMVMEYLPFTFEDRPEMEKYHELLKKHIGHLEGGEEQWYR